MIDRLAFAAPMGAIGRLTERVVLERYLRDLIEQRGAHLKAMAERDTDRA